MLNILFEFLSTFLHNIYYQYITKSYKNTLKYLKNNNLTFRLHTEDARIALAKSDTVYDYIFLDAFSPVKCPCLWTVDFFKLLHERLDENGIILTYSNAASVRHAFLEAGFFTGKTVRHGKSIGTAASKNPALIKSPLSEYDLGLIKTKAGIFYRDENLSLDNEAIIAQHIKDVENSVLMSGSKYIKQASRSSN
ncbi:MAG: hypothetical protein LBK53_07150 [Heliobacteriaceae bacterium]|jgi:tRNA U34 5-methylaminomethyl-2-thiouridine-forming methyltransferase MnmC|nr:hypothetical protein [Heliobacteriaceae bacterium]